LQQLLGIGAAGKENGGEIEGGGRIGVPAIPFYQIADRAGHDLANACRRAAAITIDHALLPARDGSVDDCHSSTPFSGFCTSRRRLSYGPASTPWRSANPECRWFSHPARLRHNAPRLS